VTLVLLLLILVVLWIVVLAPGFVKRHFEKRSTESIESFHERLHLLERTGPKIVAPAYRLESSEAPAAPQSASGYPAISSRPNLVLLRPVADDGYRDVVEADDGVHYERITSLATPVPRDDRRSQAEERRRRQERIARQRRRDLVLGLGATLVVTGLLGLIGALHLLWIVTALAAAALVSYVGLVAYAQTLVPDRRRSGPGARVGVAAPGVREESPLNSEAVEEYQEPRQAAAR
jgi:hypothetical protein